MSEPVLDFHCVHAESIQFNPSDLQELSKGISNMEVDTIEESTAILHDRREQPGDASIRYYIRIDTRSRNSIIYI